MRRGPERAYDLDCVVVGHHDEGFASHEQRLRAHGTSAGGYRNLRMDFVTLEGRRLPYLAALNQLTGASWHWTELPQVAPYYLASYLRRQGLSARPASFYGSRRQVLVDLLGRARVVAVTTTLYLSPLAARAAVAEVRALGPGASVVVGGPLVDNLRYHLEEDDFQMVLADIGADAYVLERQGEQTLARLTEALCSGRDPAGVPNCYLPRDGGWSFSGAEPERVSLDESAIDWSQFDREELGPTVQTRTARSCAFTCSFCDYPVRAGALATADVATVERELRQLDELGVRNVVFIDDTFNVPAARFKDLCRMMVRNRFRFRWYSYFRCSNARDLETYELMQDSGCRAVFLGIESGDEDVLRNMHKAASLDQYRFGMEQLRRREISTFASFIVGFPGETKESCTRTIEFINETRPTFFRGEIWFYNHRSPVHRERDKFGMQGLGHRWKHATMDWSQACDEVERMFHQVTASTWLPMYDLDFWALPYLEGLGVPMDGFRSYVESCNRLLAHELARPGSPGLPARGALEATLRERARSLAPPPPAGAVHA